MIGVLTNGWTGLLSPVYLSLALDTTGLLQTMIGVWSETNGWTGHKRSEY